MIILLPIIGFLLVLLAVFAHLLGMDTNPQWGTSRYILFFMGVVFLARYFGPFLLGKIRLSPRSKIALGRTIRLLEDLKRSAGTMVAKIQKSTGLSILIALVVLLSITYYAFWYTSQGHFPRYRSGFNAYVALGEAFLHKQVALLVQPDPRLLALDDPINDYAARESIPFYLDLSLYKGKYYAYWGPIPALLNSAIQLVSGTPPPGAVAPVIFFICIGPVLLYILFELRAWSFPRAPGISVAFFLLSGLLSMPFVFMFNRNDVYETAILGGQLFLLIGIAGWLAYIRNRRSKWLLLAGAGFAAAIGSRYNLVLAVLICVLFSLGTLWQEQRPVRAFLRRAVLLLAPLVLMAAGLAFYNHIRFQNPLETGLKYQLTDPRLQDQIYSLQYLKSNLYAYLLTPPTVRTTFPFILTNEVQPQQFPHWAKPAPGKDFEQAMLGGLPWMPICWIVLPILPFTIIPVNRKGCRNTPPVPGLHSPPVKQFFLMIALAAVAEALHMLVYYYSAMRFMADSYLLFFILLAMLVWEFDALLSSCRWLIVRAFRLPFWLAVILLACTTALIGFLISFEIPPQVFRQSNPTAYFVIADYFNNLATKWYLLTEDPTYIGASIRFFLALFK